MENHSVKVGEACNQEHYTEDSRVDTVAVLVVILMVVVSAVMWVATQ